MIKFNTVSLRNFLSYGNLPIEFNLNTGEATFIMGRNLDVPDDQSSNGVGKTTVINALVYALYGKTMLTSKTGSKLGVNDLINSTNKKNMVVTCTFTDTTGNDYVVERARKVKGEGNYVKLLCNDKDITQSDATATDHDIQRIIGMPYEMFIRIVTFSATLESFLDLPVRSASGANQTDIIEDLFDLNILSEKADALKLVIKETKKDITELEIVMREGENAYTRYQSQLMTAKSRRDSWGDEIKTKIKSIKKQMADSSDIDYDDQQIIFEQIDALTTKLTELKTKRQNLVRDGKSLRSEVDSAESELESLKDNICPYCKQDYEDSKAKQDAAQLVIDTNTPLLEAARKKTKTLNTKIGKLDGAIEELQDECVFHSLRDLLADQKNAETYAMKLKQYQTETNPHIDAYTDLKESPITKPDTTQLDKLVLEQDHQQILLKLLTKKDSFIRKALLQRNIPFLNERLAWYVNELGLPHMVSFTQEMACNISKFDKIIQFTALSSGQKARVNIALSFAFRDVLQRAHGIINVCMLDEVLDVGLDAVGIKAAARMMIQKASKENLSLFIISHRSEIGDAFSKTLTIKMKDDFSYIE